MKNKRVLAALLIAAMTVGLTACGGSSDSNGSAAGTETGSTKADGDLSRLLMHTVHLIISRQRKT